MRISDWSSDVCSSDLRVAAPAASLVGVLDNPLYADLVTLDPDPAGLTATINGSVLGLENSTGLPYDPANVVAFIDSRTRNVARQRFSGRSEEHTSELQSLMRISYAVFCLKKKKKTIILKRKTALTS